MPKTIYTAISPRPLEGRAGFISPSLKEEDPDTVDSLSAPHAAEYISAQHALAKDTEELNLIDASIEEHRMRILRSQAEIRLLERERRAVQRRMSIHRARLSPLRALPDEILQEIFGHCIPDSHYVVPHVRSAPLLLTHVCRRWRAIAQGTSELWSSISLHDRGVWNPEIEVEMIKEWLGRTRTRPIRMSITCSPHTDFGHDRNQLSSDIFQIANAHSSQLRDLSLNVNKRYLVHFIERTTFPALRSIHISLHGARTGEQLEAHPSFISAPNLRNIAITGEDTSMSIIPRSMFPQISHLTFDCNMTLDLALLLQDFHNLRHLTIKLLLSRAALQLLLPSQNDSRIVAPSLRRLDVCLDKDMLDFGEPAILEELLDGLELPALEELAIVATPFTLFKWSAVYFGDYMAWVGSPSVPSLLSRSRSPQKRFICRNFMSREDREADVLRLKDAEVVIMPPEQHHGRAPGALACQ